MQNDNYNFNGMDDSLVEICKESVEKKEEKEEVWERI